MKLKIIAIAALMVSLLVSLPKVQATFDWTGTSINSGYAITTDWHGIEVPLGEEVTAWAGINLDVVDVDIVEVKFRWLRPNEAVAWWDNVTSYTEELWEGKLIREFNATREPDELGDWGVQAIFYDTEGHGRGPVPDQPGKVAIRARSFFAVPEVSFGTIAILIAMFGAFSIFAIKKKRIP